MFENEKIVEEKICKHCEAKFEITDKNLEFYEKISPIFDGKKYLIPSPKLCPDCRQKRRLSFRNERKIYKRKCDFSGKDIVSIYSPDKKYKVYDTEIWWSDKWNSLDYGMDFDFDKGFFEQFNELIFNVPKISIVNNNSENSLFSNYSTNNKNCYLIVSTTDSENCYYGVRTYKSHYLFDFIFSYNCEDCYEMVDSEFCYKCFWVFKSNNCSNSYFLNNCQNCENCFMCSNLINKKYYIKNQQFTKEEYELNLLNYLKDDKNKLLKEFINVLEHSINKYIISFNCENVVGNYLWNSNNVYYCFNTKSTEDSKYIYDGTGPVSNVYDCSNILENSYSYELLSGIRLNNSLFNNVVRDGTNCFYSFDCYFCSDIFGCSGLKNKQYCILNKQYSKEEYEKLVPKIIEKMQETGEWGEFFPSSISPFGYNETVANEYFPKNPPVLSDIPLIKGGNGNGVEVGGFFNWSFYETPFPKVEKIITVEMYNNTSLPEDISKIPDDILNWAIECEKTGKPFRIIKQELEFYRKHNLPIPKVHPDQRHLERMALRNPRKLFERNCGKCGKNIKTTYSQERTEIIYCEICYEEEVF